MAIEIKITGNDAAETVAQFLGFAGYLGASHPLPVAVTPVVSATVAAVEQDEEPEADVAAGTVDAEGLPFDDRIHAKAKEPFKADGTWKRRKNISDDLYNSVRAELKARLAPTATVAPSPVVEQAAPAPAPQPEVVAPAPAPIVEQPAPAPVVEQVAPAPQPEVAAPAPAPAPAPATGKTHAELQGSLTKTLAAINQVLPGKATPILIAMMASYGVASINQVPADKIDDCYNRMQRMQADPANAEAIASGLM